MSANKDDSILVTGANGFVALHCIERLLKDGYRVRGTVRDLGRAGSVTKTLSAYVDTRLLSFAQVNLANDDGWASAMRGCTLVLHVASPVPRKPPKTADEVITPARDGTLRVLKAAASAGVRRVVLTSSTAAVLWGHKRDGSKTFNEDDWSILNDEVGPYEQSKTLAERAAWDFVQGLSADRHMELVTIAPGLILGPLLSPDFSISGEVVRKLLAAELPGCPNLGFAPVDVRDVADAHIAAMTHPDAANQRFIVATENVPWLRIAQILAKHYRPRGLKVPTRSLPDWLLKFVALFDKTTAVAVPELGKRQDVTCERARRVLGWRPRDLETMVVDMAESMIQHGLIKVPDRGTVRVPQHAG